MNATIDSEECTGCRLCAKLCPEVFRIDEHKAVVGVSHVPGNLERVCGQIAMDCPVGAIRTDVPTGVNLPVTGATTALGLSMGTLNGSYVFASETCALDIVGATAVRDVELLELKRLDREQRAYEADKAESVRPAARVSAPVAEAEVDVYDFEDEEDVRVAPTARPVVYVDQPTGLDYVASMSPPPAPWTGMQVTNLGVALPGVQKVCVMRGGAPLPMGGEVPFSFSHDQGSGIFTCPAAMVMGNAIYAPAGSTLYLAKINPLRQVYVVEKAYTCNPPSNATDRVARKTVTACIPQRVR